MPSDGSFELEHQHAPVNGVRMHAVEAIELPEQANDLLPGRPPRVAGGRDG